MENLRNTDVVGLIRNYSMAYLGVDSTLLEDPCTRWIDCSLLVQKYGEPVPGLLSLKNKIYTLLNNISKEISQSPTYLRTMNSTWEVREVLKEIDRISYIAKKLLEKDTAEGWSAVTSTGMKALSTLAFLAVIFIVHMCEIV